MTKFRFGLAAAVALGVCTCAGTAFADLFMQLPVKFASKNKTSHNAIINGVLSG